MNTLTDKQMSNLTKGLYLTSALMLISFISYITFLGSNVKNIKKTDSQKSILAELTSTRIQANKAEDASLIRLEQGDEQSVTAGALKKLTEEADRRGLKLTAFRPQKMRTLANVKELPCNVYVTGSFPAVQALAYSLDVPGSRLALQSVLIASADQVGSTVTATLSISAYIPTNRYHTPGNKGAKND